MTEGISNSEQGISNYEMDSRLRGNDITYNTDPALAVKEKRWRLDIVFCHFDRGEAKWRNLF